MSTVYLIAGCNGAGKTTASLTMLPEMLNCKEFVNADSIAVGISPFQPDTAFFEAGRVMLSRIEQLAKMRIDFAIETTLASKNYLSRIRNFRDYGFEITLIYFWLNSPSLAIDRIRDRVKKGGHSIPDNIVIRRYFRGINNLFKYFIPLCDNWMVIDNSEEKPEIIAEGIKDSELDVFNDNIWNQIKNNYHEKQN